MRVIVFFDLPSVTAEERREYTRFRKGLIKNGFFMLQESVYCKLALNATVANCIMSTVREMKPREGIVLMLTVTEKQFSRMELVAGEYKSEIIDSDERLVIL